VPFQVTEEFETNPVPVTVIGRPLSAVVTVLGEMPETWGSGLLIVKVTGLEAPPPGPGFTTTICAVPPTAKSEAVNAACNWVELTNVVVRLL